MLQETILSLLPNDEASLIKIARKIQVRVKKGCYRRLLVKIGKSGLIGVEDLRNEEHISVGNNNTGQNKRICLGCGRYFNPGKYRPNTNFHDTNKCQSIRKTNNYKTKVLKCIIRDLNRYIYRLRKIHAMAIALNEVYKVEIDTGLKIENDSFEDPLEMPERILKQILKMSVNEIDTACEPSQDDNEESKDK
jgi:hypothetical protein